jgi:hypothetical protein
MNTISSVKTNTKPQTQTQTFTQLLASVPPWARYSAETWVSSTNVLPDLTGNSRNATTVSLTKSGTTGAGAIVQIQNLKGFTTSSIQFPTGSLPTTYTICSLTCYQAANRNRIITADNGALFGHYAGNRGVVSNNGWQTSSTNTTTVGNWLNMVYTNSGNISVPNNILVNSTGVATANTGTGNARLSINGIGSTEQSDFRFSQLIIWNQALTLSQMNVLATALNTYLTTGVLQ